MCMAQLQAGDLEPQEKIESFFWGEQWSREGSNSWWEGKRPGAAVGGSSLLPRFYHKRCWPFMLGCFFNINIFSYDCRITFLKGQNGNETVQFYPRQLIRSEPKHPSLWEFSAFSFLVQNKAHFQTLGGLGSPAMGRSPSCYLSTLHLHLVI